jgi:hypothetical protein
MKLIHSLAEGQRFAGFFTHYWEWLNKEDRPEPGANRPDMNSIDISIQVATHV